MDLQNHQFPFHDSRQMRCPECQESIPYFDTANSHYFGCPACKTYFEVTPDGYKKGLRLFGDELNCIPNLSIGSAGMLDGLAFIVTGYLRKKEASDQEQVAWNEYLLYNQQEGYITLVDYNGHWIIVRPIEHQLYEKDLRVNAYEANYKGIKYKPYHSYYFRILFASGAFDENILELEQMYTKEYTAPPEMLVSEFLNKRTEWYHGRHMTRQEVAAAFGIAKNTLPPSIGVGSIQPSPFVAGKKWLAQLSGAMVACAVILCFALIILRPPRRILNETYPLIPDSAVVGNSRMIITTPFTLSTKGALSIGLSAALNNEWLEASVTLVNDDNGNTYDFTKSIEYYSGTDGGEHWSEGSNSESAFIGELPAGKYHLNIFPYNEKPLASGLHVSVRQNPMIWSNFILLMLAIIIVPIINTLLDKQFEKRRNSDG